MRAPGSDDREIGELHFARLDAYESQMGEPGPTAVPERSGPTDRWAHLSAATFARLMRGDTDGAARAWLQGLEARTARTRAFAEQQGRTHTDPRAVVWAATIDAVDLVRDMVDTADFEALATEWASRPFEQLVLPLLAGRDAQAAAKARELHAGNPGDRWLLHKPPPHLLDLTSAIIADDQPTAQRLLVALLDAEVHARKRGFLRDWARFRPEPAGMWAAARYRGIHIDIPDRLHHVDLLWHVSMHLDVDGVDMFQRPFRWPLDLLPTAMYARAAQLRGEHL